MYEDEVLKFLSTIVYNEKGEFSVDHFDELTSFKLKVILSKLLEKYKDDEFTQCIQSIFKDENDKKIQTILNLAETFFTTNMDKTTYKQSWPIFAKATAT